MPGQGSLPGPQRGQQVLPEFLPDAAQAVARGAQFPDGPRQIGGCGDRHPADATPGGRGPGGVVRPRRTAPARSGQGRGAARRRPIRRRPGVATIGLPQCRASGRSARIVDMTEL